MNTHIIQSVRNVLKTLFAILSILLFSMNTVTAETRSDSLIPPEDPKQSITYWKKYTLKQEEPVVMKAQKVFDVLLRAWDQSRIEPGLYVVESEVGAWAASLADGNILLSKQAIETSYSFGEQRGEHLLAFILAHELAHQRADDLWHQRFFRMIGSQSSESQKTMMAGLELDQQAVTQLQQKEAQADHDGLVLMSSVGFDPYQIVDDKDFFTLWVENIWDQSCYKAAINVDINKANNSACEQARSRALRTRTQLQTVATQSTLYELGVQAFVAGQYKQAREYFTIYGRDYPGRAVISAIGLTYFAQANEIHQQLNTLTDGDEASTSLNFYYPMLLEAQLDSPQSATSTSNKRADTERYIQNLKQQKKQLLEQGVSHFEKAIRLSPDYKQTYLLLASTHLLANNSFLVRGVLQGQYLPRFGKDDSVTMLLALTSAIEGKTQQAIKALNLLADAIEQSQTDSVLTENLISYSVFYNLSVLYNSVGTKDKAKNAWMSLAKLAKANGNTLLFRLAVDHLRDNNQVSLTKKLKHSPTINGHRLGDRLKINTKGMDLWVDGEQFKVVNNNGSRYVFQNEGRLISALQLNADSSADINHKLNIGDSADRPFKSLGMPDRHLNMTSGEYLAYDDYGLAIRLSDNQVKGWFLYDAH